MEDLRYFWIAEDVETVSWRDFSVIDSGTAYTKENNDKAFKRLHTKFIDLFKLLKSGLSLSKLEFLTHFFPLPTTRNQWQLALANLSQYVRVV